MNKDKTRIWKKWWFWLITVLMIIIVFSNKTNTDNVSNNVSNEAQIASEKTIENEYVEDDLVNDFIKNFKASSNYELTDIKNGNIKTKYFVHINGQYCELLNATESDAKIFEITIHGDNTEEELNKIIDVSKEVIKTLDSTISEENISNIISEHVKNSSNSFALNDTIDVKVYPIHEVSYGKTNCRIEIIKKYD